MTEKERLDMEEKVKADLLETCTEETKDAAARIYKAIGHTAFTTLAHNTAKLTLYISETDLVALIRESYRTKEAKEAYERKLAGGVQS